MAIPTQGVSRGLFEKEIRSGKQVGRKTQFRREKGRGCAKKKKAASGGVGGAGISLGRGGGTNNAKGYK